MGSRQYDEGWRAINELIRSGGSFSGRERKVTYRNLGNGQFADVSFLSGLDFDSDGRAFATFDLDGDGALDLLLKNRTAPQVRIMRNTLGGRSLILELRGARSNRDAVGARVTLVTKSGERMREVASGSGYLSQSSRRVHFGLAGEEEIESVRIDWPSGLTENLTGIPARGTFAITEGVTLMAPISPRLAPASRGEAPGNSRTLADSVGPASSANPVDSRRAPSASRGARLPVRLWLVDPLPAPGIKTNSRWTLLNFNAAWCPPCRSELSDWNAAAAKLKAAGVSIQYIDVDVPANQTTVATYALLYRHLYNARREMGLPVTFLLNQSGAIAKIYQGLATAEEILADASAQAHPALPFAGRRVLPASTRNWTELATALAEHGLAAPARLLFETALRRGQTSDELRNNYAAVLLESGDRLAAERQFRTLTDHPEALVNLGLLYLQSNRPQQAVTSLEKAVNVQPDDAAAWNALGMARSLAGDKARAIQALTRAQTLGLVTVNQANELGILYGEAGEAARARAQFERAVALDPRHLASHVNLATYFWRQSDAGAARLWLNRAKALAPADAAVRRLDAVVPR